MTLPRQSLISLADTPITIAFLAAYDVLFSVVMITIQAKATNIDAGGLNTYFCEQLMSLRFVCVLMQ